MAQFVHLHNHTHYSLQDAACTVPGLVEKAKLSGMPAVALTDHGVLYGVPEFYKYTAKAGIKPIVGMEAYIVVNGSRFEKQKIEDAQRKKKKPYQHLILLAKNLTGYRNLVTLSSIGFTEGFYYRPRIDMEVLRKHSEGLICTSACIGGIVSSHLVNDEPDKAKETAIIFKELFGDDFYLEIQDHGLEHDPLILKEMPRLSRQLNIKLVATNDCHYLERDHALAHNILLLMSDKTGDVDYTKLRYGTDQIYFKSTLEMTALFQQFPTAIENTLEIAEKVNLDLGDPENHFPVFPIPPGARSTTPDDYLEELALQRLPSRYPVSNDIIEKRFQYELRTIKEMGFAGYFLVVQDFINAAREMHIPVGPGRGSAAGSLIAYVLGITNIDPLPYDLLFERFLNPARNSMPDIDVDFADDQRGQVIDYVKQKYGEKCVSQIATFNRLASRQVLRDVARVLKIPIPTINNITKYIPMKFGKTLTVEEAVNTVPELKWIKGSTDPAIQDLIKYAKILEGMNRNLGKHAAGVVIAPGTVSDFVPLATTTGQDDIVTQFSMKELEANGLLKMDFLGLRTLSILRDAVALIKRNHNKEINLDTIPLNDKRTYELFSRGQTTGVFQFESAPMREHLKHLKPSSITDLSAMNALYRPGPMDSIGDFIDRKFGRKPISYLHPKLESVLNETYGVIVYQEQVIQLANTIGGMTLAEADNLRRAISKKDKKEMARLKTLFIAGAVKQGIKEDTAQSIYDMIEKFADYGFNKSHSVAYSFIAYQTAYLKAHYTPEFLSAALTNEFSRKDKVTVLLEECRKLHIDILPPDVNSPSLSFDTHKGKIRFGLSAIKNVGVNAVQEIIKKRTEIGRNFKSIFDFCAQMDLRIINKRAVEGLILAGAFDQLNKNRKQLAESVELVLDFGSRIQQDKFISENSLFGNLEEEMQIPEPALTAVEDWSDQERLEKEREMIGFYVTNHPLRKYELEYRSLTSMHLGDASPEETEVLKVRACGIITDLKTKIDSKNKTMAFLTLDDLSGSCECIMFGSDYEKYGGEVKLNAMIMVNAELESSGDKVKLHITEVWPLDSARERFTKYIKVSVEKERHKPETLSALKQCFIKHKGNTSALLEYAGNGGEPLLFALPEFKVKLTNAFLKECAKLVGEDMLTLISK